VVASLGLDEEFFPVRAFLPMLALSLVTTPPPTGTLFWSAAGHHAVASLAWARLAPATRERVLELLDGEDFVHASTWADSVRPSRRATAPWHYVNIAIWENRYDARRHCPEGNCVIGAIEKFERVLSDPRESRPDREEALRFLIHFVGDIHQPLHAGDRSDRGGNDTEVFLDGRKTNLHRVWDFDVVEVLATSEEGLVARLRQRMDQLPESVVREWESATPSQWAMEGQQLARTNAYRLPDDSRIGRAYLEGQADAIEIALLKGGVRLAALLNRSLSP